MMYILTFLAYFDTFCASVHTNESRYPFIIQKEGDDESFFSQYCRL